MDKVITEQPQHSEQLLTAVQATLKSHSLRLKPDQDLGAVVDACAAKGIKLTEAHGYLNASMTNSGVELPAHVNTVFEALAEKEAQRFYPRSIDGIESRDQMDAEGKRAYLAKHGLRMYEMLPQTAPKVVTVVLDKTKLTRADYLSLPSSERAALCGAWGANMIGQVMARTK